MSISPEKDIFKREGELKIAPEDWNRIKKNLIFLTSEVKEKHDWELREITERAKEKEVGFEEVLIGLQDVPMVYLEHPEIVSVPKEYIHNYSLVKEVIPEYLRTGLRQLFLDARSLFEKPKRKFWQKIIRDELELKKIVDKKELEKWQKKIERLKEMLGIDFRKCLSEPEIESEVIGKYIGDILSEGPERMEFLLKIYQMKKRSSSEYQKFYDKKYLEIRKEYQEKFPYLYDEATLDELAGKYFEIGENIGKEYWEYKDKEKERDFGMMYR